MSSPAAIAAVDPVLSLKAPLRALAERLLRGERRDHTLQATALLHEAFLRLRGLHDRALPRPVVLALFARTMRRVLVDHARRRRARLCAQEQAAEAATTARAGFVLDLDAALRALAAAAPRQARVVELRFFGGFGVPEVATCLGITERTVVRDWAEARETLRQHLEGELP
ncbi:MAG TPA: ECF-type sigma factor [Planctomycetota bacterium]|nr:ECF-type sigma factor [Planctomycetota bacterium]